MVGKWHLCPTDEMNLAVDPAELADRPRLRALVRLPRRRDEPVVSGPGLRQPSGRPAEARPRRATTSPTTSPTRRSSSSRTPRRSRRTSRSSCTTRRAPATRRTTPRRTGSTSSRASSTWATRRCASRRWRARSRSASFRRRPSFRRSTRSARPRPGRDRAACRSPSSTRPGRGTRSTTTRSASSARMAEVYAGFLGHADHHIGRLLDYLESTEQLDNTMIVLVSDNGASGEGGPNGSVNEMKFANGVPDDLAENLAKIDDLGSPATYNHYPNGWAMAFNTPFKMWKRYEFNGGTSDPCIISWPKGTKARGEIRDQYHHAVDIVPTILDVLGVEPPRRSRATSRAGSMASACGAASTTRRRRLTGRRSSTRCSARVRSGTRAGRPSPPIRRSPDGATSTTTSGSCTTRTSIAPSCTTWRRDQPDKVRELVNIWFAEAGANHAFPLDDRSALEIMNTPRPQLTAPRDRYVYYPDASGVPEWLAVNTRGRSFVDRCPRRHPRARSRGGPVRVRFPVRGSGAVRQGQSAALRQQLRR